VVDREPASIGQESEHEAVAASGRVMSVLGRPQSSLDSRVLTSRGDRVMSSTIRTTGVAQSPIGVPMDIHRKLLIGGIVAGPLYAVVSLVQVLTRDGFDITRDELSLLSTGSLGWVQITNFVLTGVLIVAGAVGLRHAMGSSQGGVWGPRLIALHGVGIVGSGVFVADPMNGFPPGTPPGPPRSVSLHGTSHFVVATVAFVALIAACIVLARGFSRRSQVGWAAYSVATGVVLLASFLGVATAARQEGAVLTVLNLAFTSAVLLGWIWITAVSAWHLKKSTSTGY
jgi:hypothetical membrane protein